MVNSELFWSARRSSMLALAILALFAIPAGAQIGSDDLMIWEANFGSTASDAGTAVAVDAQGNTIVAGFFSETIDFGDGPVESKGGRDIFIAKFDAQASSDGDVDGLDFLAWQRGFGADGDDVATALAVDAQGNVFVAGAFSGTVDFGGGPLSCVGDTTDMFLAKYDRDGEHLWSIAMGDAAHDDFALDLAVDINGAVITSGILSVKVEQSKFDSEGNPVWSKTIGDAGSGQGRGIATDNQGNIVLVGGFVGTVDFGEGDTTAAGNIDIFLAKWDDEGNLLWARTIGGVANDIACDVAIQRNGDIVVTGEFQDEADFGGGVISTGGRFDSDAFVVMFNPEGLHRSSSGFPGPGQSTGTSVAVTPAGTVVFTVEYTGTTNFGGVDLTSKGETDVVLNELDHVGNYNFLLEVAGIGADFGFGIATDHATSAVVVGSFQETVDFGDGPVDSLGSDDVYAAKYKLAPHPILANAVPD